MAPAKDNPCVFTGYRWVIYGSFMGHLCRYASHSQVRTCEPTYSPELFEKVGIKVPLHTADWDDTLYHPICTRCNIESKFLGHVRPIQETCHIYLLNPARHLPKFPNQHCSRAKTGLYQVMSVVSTSNGHCNSSWHRDIWGWVKTLVPSEPQNSW